MKRNVEHDEMSVLKFMQKIIHKQIPILNLNAVLFISAQ